MLPGLLRRLCSRRRRRSEDRKQQLVVSYSSLDLARMRMGRVYQLRAVAINKSAVFVLDEQDVPGAVFD